METGQNELLRLMQTRQNELARQPGIGTAEFIRMLRCVDLLGSESSARNTLKNLPGTTLETGKVGPYFLATETAVWKHLLSYTVVAKRLKRAQVTNLQEFRVYMIQREEDARVARIVERRVRNRHGDDEYE